MAERVFSASYLAQAGIPTVDLQQIALEREDAHELLDLQKQLLREGTLIVQSYFGWERTVRKQLHLEPNEYPAALLEKWGERAAALVQLAQSEQFEKQLAGSKDLAAEMLAEHDRRMWRITELMSELYREQGQEILGQVLEQVMDPAMLDPDGNKSFKERVEALIAFTRCHLLPFTVTEDEEKVTFIPKVCPSGARLIQQGAYEQGALVDASNLTWGRDQLPIYCCHEPAAEMATIRHFGAPLFLVVPAEDLAAGPCVTHMYKNPGDVPERYFKRLGLRKADDLISSSRE